MNGIFFNGIILFVDGSLLIFAVCSFVQIYQVYRGEYVKNGSYYFAYVFFFCSLPYIAVTMWYLHRKFADLNTEAIRDRIGVVYDGLAIQKTGRSVFVYLVVLYIRPLVLSVIVTFGRGSNLTQRLFFNYGSLIMIAVIATVRPFASKWAARVEIMNEFIILVLYCHCVTQTDYVIYLEGRHLTGWSMIGVICFAMLANFAAITVPKVKDFIRK